MELAGKNIHVVGMGASGLAAAQFLLHRSARVTLADAAEESALGGAPVTARAMGIRTACGPHPADAFDNADLVVISPGVPHAIPPLMRAESRGIEVIGEIELAFRFIEEPIVAVTGTNGKTTVTTLIGHMLGKSGIRAFVGGNIGTPLITYADSGERADVLVVEVSSFQLDTIAEFRPKVGVLLNITQDHQDRYTDFSCYAASKARIFKNQDQTDTAVLNGGDAVSLSACRHTAGRKLIYGFDPLLPEAASVGNLAAHIKDSTIDIHTTVERGRLDLSGTPLIGRHSHENIAAAALAALAMGGTLKGVRAGISAFPGLPHRLQYIGTINGVRYYDDSKATNVDAVIKALDSFHSPVVLIIGGRNKGNDFGLLAETVRRHVKRLIMLGEAKEEIASAIGHLVPSGTVGTMAEAVESAARAAKAGDAVLLSPACASFDMFRSYSDRGRQYQEIVQHIKDTKSTGRK